MKVGSPICSAIVVSKIKILHMVSSDMQYAHDETEKGFYRLVGLLLVHNGTNIKADWSRPFPKNYMDLESILSPGFFDR